MIRVGLIGCGVWGLRHAAAWRTVPGAVLHAVFDSDQAKARAAAGADAHTCDRLDDLLACVDAVSIATPSHVHALMVRRALDAELHVLVEKPFGVCPRAAEELAALAAAKGRILAVGYLERFHPRLSHAINSISTPMRLYVERINCQRPRDTTVGVVFDLMSHDIDTVLRWFGTSIRGLDATAKAGADGIIDEVAAELYFTDGRVAALRSSWCGTSRRRAVHIQDEGDSRKIDLLDNGHGIDLLRAQLSGFVGAVRAGTRTAASGAEAARTLSVAKRIEESLRIAGAAP